MAESSTTSCSPPTSVLWTIKDFENWRLSKDCSMFTLHLPVLNHVHGNLRMGFVFWYNKARELCLRLVIMDVRTCLKVRIKLALLDSELRLFNEKYKTHVFSGTNKPCNFNNFIREDVLLDKDNRLLHNGDLVIHCEISNGYNSRPSYHSYVNENEPARSHLASVLRILLEKQYFPDFSVIVKDKKFLCHKCVLACRSEYFSDIFQSGVKEELVLTDIEPSIFEKLLHYIYVEEINISDADAFPLLAAADKYNLLQLKILCEEKIESSLCLENAVEMFAFAKAYNLENLRMKAILMIDLRTISLSHFLSNYSLHAEKNVSLELKADENVKPHLTVKLETMHEFPLKLSTTCERKSQNVKTCLPKVNSWCRTELQLSVKDTWRIKNFKEICSSGSTALSSRNIEYNGLSCVVEARIEDSSESGKPIRTLKLHASFSSHSFLVYKFSILNVQNKETNILRGSCRKSGDDYLEIVFCENIDSILSANNLLHGDDLIVCCRFYIPNSDWQKFEAQVATPTCQLVSQISSLLRSKRFSNVVVKIGSETFLCHKAILSCYSPYFASVITNSSSQQRTVVIIDDIQADTFKKVLCAMYNGKCELMASEVWKLLSVEKKYRLFGTTSTFDDAFVSALSSENSVRVLTVVVSQKLSEKLQKYALQFITRHSEEIMQCGLVRGNANF